MKGKKNNLNVLVLGMGAYVFGKEKRAVSAFKHMPRLRPYFLVSKWEDGSVSRLLKDNNLEFSHAPFGYLGRARPLWTLDTLLHTPELYDKVVRAYLKNQCQTILFLNLHPLVNAFPGALFLKIFCGAKLVFYLGDIPGKNLFNRITAWWANQLSNCFITNSLAVKRGLVAAGIYEDKIQVIYNGVEVDKFYQAGAPDLRKEFGWAPGSCLVGYLGQLNSRKGITDFIEAAHLISQRYSNCRFLIFGRSPLGGNGLPKEISDLINARHLKEYVSFGGWKDEVGKIYQALDIVVVPSRHEDPAPNVNIEAMASGIPVVATRVGGSPELVEDGVTGFLVGRQNAKEIADRVLELAQNSSFKKTMGEAGRNRAFKMFDIKKNAAQIETILLNA